MHDLFLSMFYLFLFLSISMRPIRSSYPFFYAEPSARRTQKQNTHHPRPPRLIGEFRVYLVGHEFQKGAAGGLDRTGAAKGSSPCPELPVRGSSVQLRFRWTKRTGVEVKDGSMFTGWVGGFNSLVGGFNSRVKLLSQWSRLKTNTSSGTVFRLKTKQKSSGHLL